MTYLDLLLSQARTQRVECHYGNAQVEDANLGRPPLPIFHSLKKKRIHHIFIQHSTNRKREI